MPYATGSGEMTIAFTGVGDPEPMLCTCGFKQATLPTLTQAEAIKTNIASILAPVISTQYTLKTVALRWQADATSQVYVETVSAGSSMSASSSALPSNCAVIVRKRSTFGGKKHRGRMYFPGVPEESVDWNGDLTTTFRTDWQTRATSIFGTWTSTLGMLVIHHSKKVVVDGKERWEIDPTQTPTEVTSFAVPAKIGTQRRRMATRTFTVG